MAQPWSVARSGMAVHHPQPCCALWQTSKDPPVSHTSIHSLCMILWLILYSGPRPLLWSCMHSLRSTRLVMLLLDVPFLASVCSGSLVTPISWRNKQPVVSLSNTEVKYMAMFSTRKEIMHVRRLFAYLGVPSPGTTCLFCDHQNDIQIASNPVFYERTKHIEVDCHFVCENPLSRWSCFLLFLLLLPTYTPKARCRGEG